VLVKRLVCIEDLGDLDILVTDKTGTLTQGQIAFDAARGIGTGDDRALLLGPLASDVDLRDGVPVGGNPLDTALYRAAGPTAISGYRRLGEVPFDHERQMSSALVEAPDKGRLLVTKGAPEGCWPAAPTRRTSPRCCGICSPTVPGWWPSRAGT
jgi:P-type Mg2+ transporter